MATSGPEQGRVGVSAGEDPVHVDVRDVYFSRGDREIFAGLCCQFMRDEISVVLGGSGVGKTTLLRMLACLIKPTAGQILLDRDLDLVSLNARQAHVVRRRIGMMFQGGALLDSMSIFDNVALPLREHTSMAEAEIASEVKQVFDSVGLEDVGQLLPAELSGGMRKRAALARSLILAPDILLCDEPFSGLDPRTVHLVEGLLIDVNKRLGVTMVLTSHHIASTLRMADRIVLLLEGEAVIGTPDDFRTSEDPRIRGFLSDADSVDGNLGSGPRTSGKP